MQIERDDSALYAFLSDFVGTEYRVTMTGTAPEGKHYPRFVYEPRLTAFQDDSEYVREQLDQLNKIRNVRFLPGVRKRFVDMRGFVWFRHGEVLTRASFAHLTPDGRSKVLEAENVRRARFSCAYAVANTVRQLAHLPVTPTVLIRSIGSSFYAIWKLDQAIEGGAFHQLQTALADLVGAAPFSKDDPFIPLPGCDYIARGGKRSPVSIEFFDRDNTYSLDQLRHVCGVTDTQQGA